MAYLGRTVGIGMTKDGKPAALYGLSGRSESSKKRWLDIIDDGFVRRIKTEPIGKLTVEQKRQENLLFYNAIWCTPDLVDGKPYIVVSNGVQTDTIAAVTQLHHASDDRLERILNLFSYEPDSLKTPRIAGEIPVLVNRLGEKPLARVGIVHPKTYKQTTTQHYSERVSELRPGSFITISTYTGKDDENPTGPGEDGFDFESMEIELRETKFPDKLAQQFANDFIDEKYFVSAAAAILTDGKWHLGVWNRAGDKLVDMLGE